MSVLQDWLDHEVAADLLAEDVTFSSPVADYHGRADAAHVLGLIAGVLTDVTPRAGWGGGEDSVQAFDARVGDAEVQAMLRERRDASGALVHVTLFVRPYRALRLAVERMRELLAEHPLPSAAR